MKKNDIKIISSLIEFKMSVPCELEKLKQLKEQSEDNLDMEFLKNLFDVLELDKVYDALGLEYPNFLEMEEPEELTENKNNIYKKEFYKWF